MESIRTERLIVRDIQQKDLESVHVYSSDPEVVRFMPWGPNTMEDTKAFISHSIATQQEQPRRNYNLAVILTSQNILIGSCGIYESNPDWREGFIAYVFNHDYWGKGYATETAKALLKFGFEKLNLHRIYAYCNPANTASAHVLEKIGMQLEGHFREHRWFKGKWVDTLQYAILDHEWNKSKPQQSLTKLEQKR